MVFILKVPWMQKKSVKQQEAVSSVYSSLFYPTLSQHLELLYPQAPVPVSDVSYHLWSYFLFSHKQKNLEKATIKH